MPTANIREGGPVRIDEIHRLPPSPSRSRFSSASARLFPNRPPDRECLSIVLNSTA